MPRRATFRKRERPRPVFVCARCRKRFREPTGNWEAICPGCVDIPEHPLAREWRRFRDTPEYTHSPFPFPKRRMSLGEKILNVLLGATVVIGAIYWLIYFLVRWID